MIEDLIYANCQGEVCKWTGDQFEKATAEERRRYDGTNQVTADEVENGPGGWSQRRFGEAVSDYEFAADVSGKFTVQVTNKVKNAGGGAMLSVGFARPGQPVEMSGASMDAPEESARRNIRLRLRGGDLA